MGFSYMCIPRQLPGRLPLVDTFWIYGYTGFSGNNIEEQGYNIIP